MRNSEPAVVEHPVPLGDSTIVNRDQNRRRKRTYIRGVLSSFSEFISVCPIPWPVAGTDGSVDYAAKDERMCIRVYVPSFIT